VSRLLGFVGVQNGSARAYLLTFLNIVTVAGLFPYSLAIAFSSSAKLGVLTGVLSRKRNIVAFNNRRLRTEFKGSKAHH